jgi:hypothetical protein
MLMRTTYCTRACAHSRSSYLDGAAAAFLEAGEELGHATGDLNAELQDGGFAIPDTTTRSGQFQPRVERQNALSVFSKISQYGIQQQYKAPTVLYTVLPTGRLFRCITEKGLY